MGDGRRINRWCLVDQHGSAHLAVIGIERDTKDGHYNYNAVSGRSYLRTALAAACLLASLMCAAAAVYCMENIGCREAKLAVTWGLWPCAATGMWHVGCAASSNIV
jgi:hypothetical protein